MFTEQWLILSYFCFSTIYLSWLYCEFHHFLFIFKILSMIKLLPGILNIIIYSNLDLQILCIIHHTNFIYLLYSFIFFQLFLNHKFMRIFEKSTWYSLLKNISRVLENQALTATLCAFLVTTEFSIQRALSNTNNSGLLFNCHTDIYWVFTRTSHCFSSFTSTHSILIMISCICAIVIPCYSVYISNSNVV